MKINYLSLSISCYYYNLLPSITSSDLLNEFSFVIISLFFMLLFYSKLNEQRICLGKYIHPARFDLQIRLGNIYYTWQLSPFWKMYELFHLFSHLLLLLLWNVLFINHSVQIFMSHELYSLEMKIQICVSYF